MLKPTTRALESCSFIYDAAVYSTKEERDNLNQIEQFIILLQKNKLNDKTMEVIFEDDFLNLFFKEKELITFEMQKEIVKLIKKTNFEYIGLYRDDSLCLKFKFIK